MQNTSYLKVGLSLLVIIYCVIQAFKGGDFQIYMGAAELLREGKNCYNEWIPLIGGNACTYSYSPFFALLLIPLTYLPFPTAQILWQLASVLFLYRIFKITLFFLDATSFSQKQYHLWLLLSSVLIGRFALHNFEMVQLSIFITYCCLESIFQLKKGNTFYSGLILSIGIVVKIIPIVMVPYFIYHGRFKPAIIVFFGVLFFILFPAFFYGWDFNKMLLFNWFSVINPNNKEFLINENLTGDGVHSLSGLIAGYFSTSGKDIGAPFNRSIIELDIESIFWLLNITRLFFISFTLYFIGSRPFSTFKTRQHTFWVSSYILAVAPLIFPHQQKYAFFMMMPAVFYLTHFLIMNYNPKSAKQAYYIFQILLLLLFFLLTTITTDGIIGNRLNDLSEYYKTITFGAFILLFLLAISPPLKTTARITSPH